MDFSGQFTDLWKYLATFLTALVTSFLLVPLAMRLAVPFGMMDEPDSRRIHLKPIPRSGGLAVFIAFHLAALACYFVFWPEFKGGTDFSWWLAFAPASCVLFFIGWMDDSEGLSPWIKLLGQFTAANLFFILSDSSVGNLLGLSLPLWVEWAMTIAWFLALINAFNLIDGMDGLCAGIAVISALGIGLSFIVRGLAGDAIIALALIGAAVGFLRYNFYPARVFLGDTGSMFLGFTLAAISLQTSGKSTLLVSFGIPLVAAGIPIFDTLLAIWRRSARRFLSQMLPGTTKSKIMGADKDHLHHRLLTLGLSQRRVALLLYAGNLFLVTVGLVSILQSQVAFGFLLVILGLYAFVVGLKMGLFPIGTSMAEQLIERDRLLFIYLFAFVRFRVPELGDVDIDPALLMDNGELESARMEDINTMIGRIVNWSFFSLNLVAAIIPVFVLEPLAARFGRVRTHTVSIAIMAIGYWGVLQFGYAPALIYALMAVVGIGWAATISLPFAIMSQKIPQSRMGLYMGLFNLSVVLPQFVSSFGIGEIVDDADDKGIIFIVSALTVGISALLWAFVKEPKDVYTENPVLAEEQENQPA